MNTWEFNYVSRAWDRSLRVPLNSKFRLRAECWTIDGKVAY